MINGGYREEGSRYTRIPVEYKATYAFGNITGEGLVTDISEGGIAMRTRQAFVVEDELKIRFMVTKDMILDFTGEVRSIQGNILGILIKEIEPEMMIRFKDHIDGMLRLIKTPKLERYALSKKVIQNKKRRM